MFLPSSPPRRLCNLHDFVFLIECTRGKHEMARAILPPSIFCFALNTTRNLLQLFSFRSSETYPENRSMTEPVNGTKKTIVVVPSFRVLRHQLVDQPAVERTPEVIGPSYRRFQRRPNFNLDAQTQRRVNPARPGIPIQFNLNEREARMQGIDTVPTEEG